MSIDQSFSFSTQLLPLNISKVAEELIVFVFVELKIGMRIQKIFLSFPFFLHHASLSFILHCRDEKKRNLHGLNVFNVNWDNFKFQGKNSNSTGPFKVFSP